jgi:hypothetical protein
MAIHGFVLEEDTKPVGERNLQALKVASQAYIPATWTNLALPIWIQY